MFIRYLLILQSLEGAALPGTLALFLGWRYKQFAD